MNNNPVINRNHFLPTLYLKGFEDIKGVLWRYDKKDGKILDGNAEFFGFEKKLYHPEPPAHPNKYEYFFRDRIEAPAASVLRRLRGKHLPSSNEERSVLSQYLAALLVRTPGYIEHLQKQFDTEFNLLNLTLARHQKYNEDHKKFWPTEEEYKESVEAVLSGEIGICATRDFVLSMMTQLIPITTFLMAHMSWILIEKPSEEGFVTTDNLNYIHNPHINPTGLYSPGFGMQDSSIYIPVSSNLTLKMVQDCKRNDVIYDTQNFDLMSDVLLREYNCHNISAFNVADRFVFSDSQALLESLVRHRGNN